MIGALRHRVTVQRNTTSSDGKGGQTASWGTLATVWASVEPSTPKEDQQAGAMTGTLRYRVRLRLESVTPQAKDRVLWDSKTLEILGPPANEGGRDRMWLLDCGEVG